MRLVVTEKNKEKKEEEKTNKLIKTFSKNVLFVGIILRKVFFHFVISMLSIEIVNEVKHD